MIYFKNCTTQVVVPPPPHAQISIWFALQSAVLQLRYFYDFH